MVSDLYQRGTKWRGEEIEIESQKNIKPRFSKTLGLKIKPGV